MESSRPRLQLSEGEMSLLQLAAAGAGDIAIAQKLGINEATVGIYWERIRAKIGPYSRTELVAIVLRSEQDEALAKLKEENALLVRQLREASQEQTLGDEFHRRLIENAPVAMMLLAADGTLAGANAAAHDLFGYEPGTMDGLDLLVLIPPDLREIHKLHRAQYVSDPRRRTMGEHLETPALHRSGKRFYIRAALSAIETPNGLVITCAIRKADAPEEL